MKEFTFNCNGKMFTVRSRDMDRARSAAKRMAGSEWTSKARCVKVSFGSAA